jgi:hypothetical protein
MLEAPRLDFTVGVGCASLVASVFGVLLRRYTTWTVVLAVVAVVVIVRLVPFTLAAHVCP